MALTSSHYFPEFESIYFHSWLQEERKGKTFQQVTFWSSCSQNATSVLPKLCHLSNVLLFLKRLSLSLSLSLYVLAINEKQKKKQLET
jgi:hypothetical protein